MGKKPEKPTSGNELEALSIESWDTRTALLLLKSSEEIVLQKATTAIYKYISNCINRKKEVSNACAIDVFWNLLSHDNKTVRRNTTMIIGCLCSLDDVVRLLKKRDDLIKTLQPLLATNEEAFTIEFCLRILASVSLHYTGRRKIMESNILESVAISLNTNVAETQANALNVLLNILADEQAVKLYRELNIFQSLLNLLQSEYPTVQKNALLLLCHLSINDVLNRNLLGDLNLPSLLIDFLSNSKFSDCHGDAINVLANFLVDLNHITKMKLNGSLNKLIAIVMDQPIKEEKPVPVKQAPPTKTNKAVSSQSRKGKAANQELENTESVAPIDITVPTLPVVKEKFCLALAKACCQGEIRQLLYDMKLEAMCCKFLKHPCVAVQLAACQLLALISESYMSRDYSGKIGTLEPLVELLRSNECDVVNSAILSLSSIVLEHEQNCRILSKNEDFEAQVCTMLDSDNAHLVVHSAIVLYTMGQLLEDWRVHFVYKLMPYFVPLLKNEVQLVLLHTLHLIKTYVKSHEERLKLISYGAFNYICELVDSADEAVFAAAAETVEHLVVEETVAKEIIRLGGLDTLLYKRESVVGERVANKIMAQFLPAKFAITNKLDSTDLIKDYFYDVGQLSQGSRFLLAEDYLGQPINNKRPILYVNGADDSCESPLADEEINSKDKEKESQEKEPKQKETNENREPNCLKEERLERSILCSPALDTDVEFLEYLKEISELLPFSCDDNLKERAEILAIFVCDKMGGVYEKTKLINFGWQLSIGQYKFAKNSNLLPIGCIKKGIYYHRALLFKAIGDRFNIPSRLVRGDGLMSWNEIDVAVTTEGAKTLLLAKEACLVDLAHNPGSLEPIGSPRAIQYLTLFQ